MISTKLACLLFATSSLLAGAAWGQAASAARGTASQPNTAQNANRPAGQPLTAAELAKINAVLAPYKSASMSAADAKTIKRTLRDAGFRRSKELDAALVAAGFSPEKMDQLDPPPPRPAGESAPPRPAGESPPPAPPKK